MYPIDELEEDREMYLGGLCHSLSQPLQAISGFAELMNMTDSPEKLKEYGKRIQKQMDQIEKIMKKIHRIREKTDRVKLKSYLNSMIVDLDN